ncbi:hypothetical protein EG835_01640 [bacterium]|nr:hypothetical protein [bacterium]
MQRQPLASRLAELEFVEPDSAEEWRSWLEANHDRSPGIWLAVGKKGNSVTSLTYELAIEEALAFGWIDSTVNRLDEHRFKQLFTPRRPGGTWAPSNKRRVKRLIAEGRMRPAGLAVIEAAKADGSWDLLENVESLVIPADLADALANDERAANGFDAFPDSAKKQLLWWIESAKRPETRARRILSTVETAAAGRFPP